MGLTAPWKADSGHHTHLPSAHPSAHGHPWSSRPNGDSHVQAHAVPSTMNVPSPHAPLLTLSIFLIIPSHPKLSWVPSSLPHCYSFCSYPSRYRAHPIKPVGLLPRESQFLEGAVHPGWIHFTELQTVPCGGPQALLMQGPGIQGKRF